MKALMLSAVLLVLGPALATAGEIYGTIKEAGKPVTEGLKVEVTCAGTTAATVTDKFGAYRVFAQDEGKCTLALSIGDQKPSIEIHSFEDSARYNLLLEKKGDTYELRSE